MPRLTPWMTVTWRTPRIDRPPTPTESGCSGGAHADGVRCSVGDHADGRRCSVGDHADGVRCSVGAPADGVRCSVGAMTVQLHLAAYRLMFDHTETARLARDLAVMLEEKLGDRWETPLAAS